MFRKLTRNRLLFAGAAATLAAAIFGSSFNPAQAHTSFGADRIARAEALAAALDAYTEAARTCDLDVTREAYFAAETVFNAVEIDHQFASPERYNFFEHIYIQDQVPVGLGLEGDDPYDCATTVRLAEEQAAAWDEVITFLANSPEDSPLFNDVATLRTVNQHIRLARSATDGVPDATPQTAATAPDPAEAAAEWAQFLTDYPVARALIAFRNEALATEIDGLVANVSAAFESGVGVSEALAALAGRYGFGQTLVTAAARNTIPSQSTQPVFDPEAFSSVDLLGDIVITFGEMRDLLNQGGPTAPAEIQTLYSDWIEYPLSFKTGGPLTRANVAFETALAAYVAEQTPATEQALRDQIDIAEQIFVGQYWGTPELVEFMSDITGPGGVH